MCLSTPSAVNGTVTVDVRLEGPLPAGAVPDLSVDGVILIERLDDMMRLGQRLAQAKAEGQLTIRQVAEDFTNTPLSRSGRHFRALGADCVK